MSDPADRIGPMLIVVCGLPATGKTTLSRALAEALAPGALHLRVDTIEQAVVDAGAAARPLGPVGYAVAQALASDFLRQGLTVIAECVNPVPASRDAWRDLATALGVPFTEIETVCSDPAEHAHRATTRTSDIPGLPLPTWQDIRSHRYAPWTRPHLTLDTAHTPLPATLAEALAHLGAPA